MLEDMGPGWKIIYPTKKKVCCSGIGYKKPVFSNQDLVIFLFVCRERGEFLACMPGCVLKASHCSMARRFRYGWFLVARKGKKRVREDVFQYSSRYMIF